MQNLYLIGNEKINLNKNFYFSKNIDFKTLTECLNKNFNLKLIARNSNEKQKFRMQFNKIYLAKNIILFMFELIISLKKKNSKYLIVSLTPYTFLAFLILFIFNSNVYLYLRSDGFKEYEFILGKKWIFLYKIMFNIVVKRCKIISCHKSLSKGYPFYYVRPTELENFWFKKKTKTKFKKNINFRFKKKIKLLYVGRVSAEKGIFYLLNIFIKLVKFENYKLTVVGDKFSSLFDKNHIKFIDFLDSPRDLIKQYDQCDIFILPSYTEAHPKVLDEALARHKPVLIFDNIRHVIEDRKGVFSIKRDINQFRSKITYIRKNYNKIVDEIKNNKLPTKNMFTKNLVSALNAN